MIRASAGTGKTYRLSLEFINLLLKYRIDFEEILVITFTKKATAEIRERIFKQLFEIVNCTSEGEELKKSIQQNINPEIQFTVEDMNYLKTVYQKILTHKSAVRISTIDSFVNTIFSGIIAPFHNISEFQIDNKINAEILPEIYERILRDEKLEIYKDIFLQAKYRNLEQFNQAIINIIENRWLFEFIDLSDLRDIDIEVEKDKACRKYKTELRSFLDLLQTEIIKKGEPANSLLQKDFAEILVSYLDFSTFEVDEFADKFFEVLKNTEFLDNNFKLLLDDNKNLWNGNKLRNKELKELYANLQAALADFFYFDKALIEQLNIISLAADVLQVYDEIKFRDKIFTHSDISYYTFRFLYDPQLSIVDNGNVLNVFYEQLSYSTRFVLIDEFQDTSILQWSIFKPMLREIISGIGQKDYGSVIVVGDEKQAIYGWRGGERKLLTDFENILNHPVNYDTLKTSFRSKPILMNWLNRLFGSEHLNFVEDWDYTEINCAKPEGGFVQVQFRNAEAIQGIQDKLERTEIYREFVQNVLQPNLAKQKINPADTAILMRKNDELKEMAQVMAEAGIEYTLETSGSLFVHHAIKPIIFILNFLVYEDFAELIKFLRSDLVLMYPEKLKLLIEKYKNSENINASLQENDLHSCLRILYKLKHLDDSLLVLIKSILEEFGFARVFSSEIELKNLQKFLEVVAEFERSNHEYTADATGFLQYCRSLADKDEYSQIGQNVSNSIKLLTIHKSKGLQFETVFAVFDVTGKSGGNNSGLKLYYQFSEDFRSLQDFAFTFNYDKVMQKSRKADLIEYVNKRDTGDELNNIYVALTRAKNNLFLYLHYNKKGDLEKFITDVKDDGSVLKNVTKTIFQKFNEELVESSPVHHLLQFGELSKEEMESENQLFKAENLPDFFRIFSLESIREIPAPNLHKLKNEFLKNKSILIGNIVHEYLAHIKYYEPAELEIARNRTIAKYGSLLPQIEIATILGKIDIFINSHSKYFAKSKWDKVFNEHTIFNENSKELRIDRLMINTKTKEILIVDFKTGSVYEEEQLDKYKAIIEKLPVVKRENYRVETEYVEIFPS